MKIVQLKDLATKLHFKKMTADDLRKSGSFTLSENGSFIGIMVIPASAVKRQQIEAMCSQMNNSLGLK